MLLSWGFAEQEYQCWCGLAASILQGWHSYGTKPKGDMRVLEVEWSVLGSQHTAGIALPWPCTSMCISTPMHGSIPVHISTSAYATSLCTTAPTTTQFHAHLHPCTPANGGSNGWAAPKCCFQSCATERGVHSIAARPTSPSAPSTSRYGHKASPAVP